MFKYLIVLLSYYGLYCAYEVWDEDQYKIVWDSNPEIHEPLQSITIQSARGEGYECVVPLVNRTKSEASHDYSIDTNELLEQLIKTQPCSTRLEYYWTYELCHNKHIRQFHEHISPDESTTLQEYYLGRFQKDDQVHSKSVSTSKPPTITVGEKTFPYFKTHYVNGTHCDLTDLDRSTSVLYICHEEAVGGIIQVSEIETCKYEIIFATKLLCGNPAYMVSKPVIPVSCVAKSGASAKPAALIELENERKELSHSGLSSLAGLLGSAFKHIQIETERKDDFSIVYRIRAVNKEPEDDLSIDLNKESPQPDSKPSPANIGKEESWSDETLNTYPRTAIYNQLVSFLRGEFCLVGRTAGWWKHEICFRSNVTQFHLDDRGKRVQNFLLGEWNREAHDQWSSGQSHSIEEMSKRRVDLFYGNGDFCDQINESRQSLVKIRCDRSIRGIYLSFAEQSACNYSVLVESASFCDMSDEEWNELVL